MWGSNQKCPLESDRSVNGATQMQWISGSIKLPQHDLGQSPSLKWFLENIDQMELVFVNCLPCQKDWQEFQQVDDVVILFLFE